MQSSLTGTVVIEVFSFLVWWMRPINELFFETPCKHPNFWGVSREWCTTPLCLPAGKSRVWGCLHTLAKLSCFRWAFWSYLHDYLSQTLYWFTMITVVKYSHTLHSLDIGQHIIHNTKVSACIFKYLGHARYILCMKSFPTHSGKKKLKGPGEYPIHGVV